MRFTAESRTPLSLRGRNPERGIPEQWDFAEGTTATRKSSLIGQIVTDGEDCLLYEFLRSVEESGGFTGSEEERYQSKMCF